MEEKRVSYLPGACPNLYNYYKDGEFDPSKKFCAKYSEDLNESQYSECGSYHNFCIIKDKEQRL